MTTDTLDVPTDAEAEEAKESLEAWEKERNELCHMCDQCGCTDVMRTGDFMLAAALTSLGHPTHETEYNHNEENLKSVIFKRTEDLWSDVVAHKEGTLRVPLKAYLEAFIKYSEDAKPRLCDAN
jgi:hypothetical protein